MDGHQQRTGKPKLGESRKRAHAVALETRLDLPGRFVQMDPNGNFEFVREPTEAPYGTVAVFKDLYGTLWDLVQPKG